MIYKILSKADWDAACLAGRYEGSADDKRDGFIHFSAAHQLQVTARKYFSGQPDLLLIAFEEADLGEALRWEPSRGGDLFPHLYASLETKLARSTVHLALDVDGAPLIPEGVS